MKLVIKLINTQIGHRTSFVDEKNKLSDMNSRLRWIQKDQLSTKLNLSFSMTNLNQIRNDKAIYNFDESKNKPYKIKDLYHKVNNYHKNFLF